MYTALSMEEVYITSAVVKYCLIYTEMHSKCVQTYVQLELWEY